MLNPNLSILNPGHYETSKMDHLTDHAMRFRLEGRRYALALIHPLAESARQLETALLAPSGHMCKEGMFPEPAPPSRYSLEDLGASELKPSAVPSFRGI